MARLPFVVEKVISGGQTGADRGALYGALDAGVAIGGWAPAGWLAEDGEVPADLRAHMQTTPSADYAVRTRKNVDEAQATLLLHTGHLGAGSSLTARAVIDAGRLLWVQNLAWTRSDVKPAVAVSWDGGPLLPRTDAGYPTLRDILAVHEVRILNVAGPRASHAPLLQNLVRVFVRELFAGARA